MLRCFATDKPRVGALTLCNRQRPRHDCETMLALSPVETMGKSCCGGEMASKYAHHIVESPHTSYLVPMQCSVYTLADTAT